MHFTGLSEVESIKEMHLTQSSQQQPSPCLPLSFSGPFTASVPLPLLSTMFACIHVIVYSHWALAAI